jgi:hypothetical protein
MKNKYNVPSFAPRYINELAADKCADRNFNKELAVQIFTSKFIVQFFTSNNIP